MGTRKLFKAWRGSGPDGSPGSWHFREMARMRGGPVYFLDHFPTTSIVCHRIFHILAKITHLSTYLGDDRGSICWIGNMADYDVSVSTCDKKYDDKLCWQG
jgi:hypothetical protein